MAKNIVKAEVFPGNKPRGGARTRNEGVSKLTDSQKMCQLAFYINGEQHYFSLPRMYVTAAGNAAIENNVFAKGSDPDKLGRKIFRRFIDDIIEKTGVKKII